MNDFGAQQQPWLWSDHAKTRLQQRGIAQSMAGLLLDQGTQEQIGNGCLRVFFAKRDWPGIQCNLTHTQGRLFEKCRRLFAVINRDGVIVTVGHQYRRRRHH